MSSSNDASQQQFQRLKVEDALSYLDKVKMQFGNQPQVYNDFLDIMKEFKSQSIDTPGVIGRVSNLFKGHPDLIVGFNTFLPPGFKIEVTKNESGATIVHTVSQFTTQSHQTPSSTSEDQTSSRVIGNHPSSVVAAAAAAVSIGPQPVEFNQAVNYVNKIRSRFQNQPDIYKAFLEILHTYQKEQRIIKEGGTPASNFLTENEVYARVSDLFKDEDDLLAEFGQFLPDCTAHFSGIPSQHKSGYSSGGQSRRQSGFGSSNGKTVKAGQVRKPSHSSSASTPLQPPSKKPKSSTKDILAEAGKHSYADQVMFDKIRKTLKSPDAYDNFLRCLLLFNEEIVTRNELIGLANGYLGRYPELFHQFKSFLGYKDSTSPEPVTPSTTPTPLPVPPKERVNELKNELDFNNLKRYGASYRALPKSCQQAKCSGRTDLCREVLNDIWVSFPTWSEGDSQFMSSRKTQFEEQVFRCEDERFELDVVLETNLSTIRVFEALQRKMEQMSQEELNEFHLDDCLGGTSKIIHRKAIHRIYGDRGSDIIEGLKRNPSVAIPIVLRRLKAKQEEWLEAQRSFNKIWREQHDKYYLKSLDHQGISFKASDSRYIRSKSLVSEIETICDERQDHAEATGPHLTIVLPRTPDVFRGGIVLLLFYLNNNTTLQRPDRLRVKSFLCHFLHNFYFQPSGDYGNDEEDLVEDSDSETMDVDLPPSTSGGVKKGAQEEVAYLNEDHLRTSTHSATFSHHLFFCNNTWYVFFRLFQLLCERLNRIYRQAKIEAERETSSKDVQNKSASVLLGLKKPVELEPSQFYSTFIELLKSLLEGRIDNTTFEDNCREIFGVHAFITFTLDKVIQGIMRQVVPIALDESCSVLTSLYLDYVRDSSKMSDPQAMSALEAAYQKKVESVVNEDNCYRVVLKAEEASVSLSMELLDVQSDPVDELPETRRWREYMSKFTKPNYTIHELKDMVGHRKIYLMRNRRNWPDETGYSGDSDEEEEEASHKPPCPRQALTNVTVQGKIEFKFDKNSYRMVPLANSEDFMYRTGSMHKARQLCGKVCSRRMERFQTWYQSWSGTHVQDHHTQACDHWLQAITLHPGLASKKSVEDYLGRKRNKYITTVSAHINME
jgi:paired amphipathic helix protein Sin3a